MRIWKTKIPNYTKWSEADGIYKDGTGNWLRKCICSWYVWKNVWKCIWKTRNGVSGDIRYYKLNHIVFRRNAERLPICRLSITFCVKCTLCKNRLPNFTQNYKYYILFLCISLLHFKFLSFFTRKGYLYISKVNCFDFCPILCILSIFHAIFEIFYKLLHFVFIVPVCYINFSF